MPYEKRMIGRTLPETFSSRLANGRWLRTAHRGAPLVAPGNSRRALEAAVGIGVDLVEVDVHATRDGRIVLWHDDEVVGEDGFEHIIRDSSFDELRAVDIGGGQRVIELAEGAGIVRGRAGLMIDLKADHLENAVVKVLRDLEFEEVIVCGGYWRSLREFKRLEPRLGTSLTLSGDWRRAYGIASESEIDTDAVTVDGRLLEPAFVERLHARGLPVLAWTIDRLEDMRALLEMGADGLTSNRPDLFASLEPIKPGSAPELKP